MNNVEKIKQEAQALRDKLNDRVDENEFIAGEVFSLNYLLSYINIIQEEPVNEDLATAADKYVDSIKDKCSLLPDMGIIAFHTFKAGAEWQKQQIMKDAIEGTICVSAPEPLVVRAEVKEEDGFKFADHVKIIVIKED